MVLPAYARAQATLEKTLPEKLAGANYEFLPADDYMRQWNYRYGGKDSLRVKGL